MFPCFLVDSFERKPGERGFSLRCFPMLFMFWTMAGERGAVYLVGAGPGDVGLLTMRGGELLGRAEVVIYDALVNPDLLKLAPRDCELIYAGKRADSHAMPQAKLNRLLAEKARQGRTVVRLKGGDPYVFGRGGEEAESLRQAGVRFEVVPGVSSIVAAANYAGIPITHRDFCSGFAVITGHEDPMKPSSGVDWAAFAKMPGTKIILMGTERMAWIAEKLIACGMKPSTPTGMVRWGTTGRQQVLTGALNNIADQATQTGFQAPTIAVIGEVVGLRQKLNWFEERPLFGQRTVITRTREQASRLSCRLRELGAEVLEIPIIKIEPPTRKEILAEALASLGEYDWLVFTSPNGVTAFFDYFFRAFDDLRALGNLRIAAVGPATAEKIEAMHLRVDAMPKKYLTSELVAAIEAVESVENLKILLARAEIANPELPQKLTARRAIVDDVPIYQTLPEKEDRNGAAARLWKEGADWVTFSSSSTVQHFHQRFDLARLKAKYPHLKFASIGPETSKALTELGEQPNVEATEHTIDGLASAMLNYASDSSDSK